MINKLMAGMGVLLLSVSLILAGCDDGGGGGGGPGKVATPTAAPTPIDKNNDPRTFAVGESITLTTNPIDAAIYYTIDGTTPTTDSTLYLYSNRPKITTAAITTIKAIAVKDGMTDSEIMEENYRSDRTKIATPTASVEPGAVASGTLITLETATDGAIIYYNYTRGIAESGDMGSSTQYLSPILITTEAPHFYAFATDGTNHSSVLDASYSIIDGKLVTPTAKPGARAVTFGTPITLETTSAGATIYYTTDGTTPTESSTKYLPISKPRITETDAATIIKAIAVKDGMTKSEVLTTAYTLSNDYIKPVTGITGIPTIAAAGPLQLKGTVFPTVLPRDATRTEITWSVKDAGETGAVVNQTAVETATEYWPIISSKSGTLVVTATILYGKSKTEAYTKDFTIEIKDRGSADIDINSPGAIPTDLPELTVSPAEPAAGYGAATTITFTAAGTGFSDYAWYLDGISKTETSNPFALTTSSLDPGSHSVTVIAVKGGIKYSATKNFKVATSTP